MVSFSGDANAAVFYGEDFELTYMGEEIALLDKKRL